MGRTRIQTATLPVVKRSQLAHISNSASHVFTSPRVPTTEPIRVHYLQTLFSLSATGGSSPTMNCFSYYLEYPIFPDDQQRQVQIKPGRLPGGRIFQFVYDVLGHPDIRPMILLNPTAAQLMLDGKAVFDANDPERTANELVQSFSHD